LARFLKSSAERRTVEEHEAWNREEWERDARRAGAGPMPSASTSCHAGTPSDRSPTREEVSHGSL
jgi:hypothetical protein